MKNRDAAETCLPDLLNSQALARPSDIAVVHEGESLTFRELADQAEDVARYLHHLGGAGMRAWASSSNPHWI